MIQNSAAATASNRRDSFLARLRKDKTGNTLALMAAALFPLIGLVGSGVDMGRIYLVTTRLQAACDSGSLMGRKVMATSNWSANNNAANAAAIKSFDANFESGSYGTTSSSKAFTETSGNVEGTASATLPMTLMKAFGQGNKVISVTCNAEMRIPNTDVMFVLDTTGSMANKAVSTDTESKIVGLKKAVKCFYEALAKENVADISPADCGETANPVGGNASSVQLRFGFVPYAINVNVGRLLPTDAMADDWTYQSREPVVTFPNVATVGTYGTATTGSTSTGSATVQGWDELTSDFQIGSTWYYTRIRSTSAQCTTYAGTAGNVPANGTTSTGGTPVETNPVAPVFPATTHTKTYQTTTTSVFTEYSYSYNNSRCRLYKRTTSTPTTVNTTRTASVAWSTSSTPVFQRWSYEPVTFDVTGLKAGPTNWNSSLSLPIGARGANSAITWNGCIEERQTHRVTDSNPADDWAPMPTEANDMNINMVPNPGDVTTLWGPLLGGAVRQRTTVDSGGWPTSTKTLSTVFLNDNYDGDNNPNNDDMGTIGESCPRESRLYQSWSSSDFQSYVNSLTTGGNTYHDIGLIWGGRLASPEGMFASLTAPTDKTIERHMIFMTDGDTNAGQTDYSPYGVHWYDRRQTNVASAPADTLLEANIDARTAALCAAIKNENITLWVVSYGSDVTSATNQRLAACASPGKFYQATSVAGLVNNFKGMASDISALRLTQ